MRQSLITVSCLAALVLVGTVAGHAQKPAETPSQLVAAYDSLADVILGAKQTEWNLVHSILAMTYGHAEGATQLFEVLKKQHDHMGGEMPEFFATHPLDEHRTATVKALALQNGWSLDGTVQAIPEAVSTEIKRLHKLRQATPKKKAKPDAKPSSTSTPRPTLKPSI